MNAQPRRLLLAVHVVAMTIALCISWTSRAAIWSAPRTEVEMVQDACTARIGGERLPAQMGERTDGGLYEANSSAIETIIFPGRQNFGGASQNLDMTEHFTHAAPDIIVYKFTVDGPRFTVGRGPEKQPRV
jgi:hypothetical protein